MKQTLTLLTCLCLLLTLLFATVSCGGSDQESSTQPTEAEAYRAELLDFYHTNKDVMTRVAKKVLDDGIYAYHTYFPTAAPGGASSEVYSYVMPTKEGESFERVLTTDETLLALAQTTFYGDVTHTEGNTAVAFRPTQQVAGTTFYLVYAASDSDQAYLKNDFLPSSASVTVFHIEGDWYLVAV